jgi:hypothetical protein
MAERYILTPVDFRKICKACNTTPEELFERTGITVEEQLAHAEGRAPLAAGLRFAILRELTESAGPVEPRKEELSPFTVAAALLIMEECSEEDFEEAVKDAEPRIPQRKGITGKGFEYEDGKWYVDGEPVD